MHPVTRSSRALLYAAAVCSALSLSDTAAFAQSPGGTPAPAGSKPEVAAPAEAAGNFADRVANFVADFYLSGDERSEEDLERLYAMQVAYFGSGLIPRGRVIADKKAYFSRWPQRSYQLVRETLKVDRRPGSGKVYDVAFEYTFDVSSSAKTSRGRGVALLTMDLDQDGGRITREGGKVLQRW